MDSKDEVEPWAEPFAGVDGARFQCGDNFATGQRLGLGADPPQDLTTEARHPDFEPIEIIDRAHFSIEPAAHLAAGVSSQEWLQIIFGAQTVPNLLAAAMIDPGRHLGCRQPERDRGKEIERLRLSLPK